MKEYRCAKCGGDKLQIRAWTVASTGQWISDCSEGDSEDNWCEDCEEHTDFKLIETDEAGIHIL